MAEIVTVNGEVSIVDEEDFIELSKYKWYIWQRSESSAKYVIRNRIRSDDPSLPKTIYMSRQIMKFPKGKDVDHKNHNTLDNRKSNLRVGSSSDNSKNVRIRSDNKSGVTGVQWNKRSQKWNAVLMFEGRVVLDKLFNCKKDAIRARQQAELDYFGEWRYRGEEDEGCTN